MQTLCTALAIALLATGFAFSQTDVGASSDTGTRATIPLLTATTDASGDWHFNPLGFQGTRQTWSKDLGLLSYPAAIPDITIQAVANAPVQWGLGTTALLLGFDAFGSQTWLRHQLFDGGSKKDDPPATPEMPTIQNSGTLIVVQNGSGTTTVNLDQSQATTALLRPDLVQVRSVLYAKLDMVPTLNHLYASAR